MPLSCLRKILKQFKRFAILMIGSLILLTGIAMIVLPGPAMVVIPLGLALLATEFLWARTLLHHLKQGVKKMDPRKKKVPSSPPSA